MSVALLEAFTQSPSSELHDNPTRQVVSLVPFYRQGNAGTERAWHYPRPHSWV